MTGDKRPRLNEGKPLSWPNSPKYLESGVLAVKNSMRLMYERPGLPQSPLEFHTLPSLPSNSLPDLFGRRRRTPCCGEAHAGLGLAA